MVTGETRHTAWDRVRGAHNPEVAGSNPAPATKASQVRGPFPLGEGLLHVWPVTRSVTRSVMGDVSGVPLRLRRNAELRFVGHIASCRDTRDAVAGSKPGGRTWSRVGLSRTFEYGVVTDSTPPTAQVIVDGDELECGAAVGAGE